MQITETAQRFKVGNDWHMIDRAGNHFINGRCVNPTELPSSIKSMYKCTDGESGEIVTDNIGDTYPPEESRQYFKVLGHIPLEKINGKMYVKRGYEHLIN